MSKKTNTIKEVSTVEAIAVKAIDQTNLDLMIAVLVVSVVINLFILIGWVTLKVTGAYDAEVATLLFTR